MRKRARHFRREGKRRGTSLFHWLVPPRRFCFFCSCPSLFHWLVPPRRFCFFLFVSESFSLVGPAAPLLFFFVRVRVGVQNWDPHSVPVAIGQLGLGQTRSCRSHILNRFAWNSSTVLFWQAHSHGKRNIRDGVFHCQNNDSQTIWFNSKERWRSHHPSITWSITTTENQVKSSTDR